MSETDVITPIPNDKVESEDLSKNSALFGDRLVVVAGENLPSTVSPIPSSESQAIQGKIIDSNATNNALELNSLKELSPQEIAQHTRDLLGGRDVQDLIANGENQNLSLLKNIASDPKLLQQIQDVDPYVFDILMRFNNETASDNKEQQLALDELMSNFTGNPNSFPALCQNLDKFLTKGGNPDLLRSQIAAVPIENQPMIINTCQQPLLLLDGLRQVNANQESTDKQLMISPDEEAVMVGEQKIPFSYMIGFLFLDLTLFRGYHTQEMLESVVGEALKKGMKSKFGEWGFDTSGWGKDDDRSASKIINALNKDSLLKLFLDVDNTQEMVDLLEFIPPKIRERMFKGEDFGDSSFFSKKFSQEELKQIWEKVDSYRLDQVKLDALGISGLRN